MHPFFQNARRLVLYLGVWVVLGFGLAALLAFTRNVAFGPALTLMGPPAVIYGVICMSAFWVCRSLPLDRTAVPRLLFGWIFAAAQASAVWITLSGLWLLVLARGGMINVVRNEMIAGSSILFLIGVPLYFVSIVFHYLLLTFEASRTAERRIFESEVTAREAEVRALRAQLNPHFLFNSLNSINSLVGSNPEGARKMCESLGEFLRRTLALGSRDAVPLDEELSLVDRYFEIERVRFGERLRVERFVESGAERCLVPPLLLQPLVENAIKHGVSSRIEGGTVRLGAMVVDELLRVSVENEVDEDAVKRPGEGVGLQNVRRRLDAVSARDARLDTYKENGRFRVTLSLPARRAEAGAGAAGGGKDVR